MLRLTLFLLIVPICFGCSDHGNSSDDYLVRTVEIDGRRYQYRVFLPKKRDANKRLPVMLYLHGSGARGDDNVGQIDGFRWAIDPVKGNVDFAVVLPQCRKDTFWSSVEMTNYALAALDATISEFNGDETRLYLAGFSLGGYGTWQIAAANPGKFAALVPIGGGVVREGPIEPRDRAAIIPEVGLMLDSAEPYRAVADAIGETPVWVFHGAADDAVPVEFARRIVKALNDAGNRNVKYTEFPNDGHMIFGRSMTETGFLEWLSQQKLNGGK